MCLIKDSKAKVLTPDRETKICSISEGVLQGNTLNPFIFVITLDYAMRHMLDGK